MLPDQVVNCLYRTLESLERRWRDVELADDFGARMIDATFRLLTASAPESPEDEAACARRAVRLLRYVWQRSARRDAVRLRQARLSGARPTCIPLSLLPEEAVPAACPAPFGGETMDAGETGYAVVAWLQAQGWPRERAWAFVWYAVSHDWSDVAFLLRERLGYRATSAQLRQWGSRYFEPIKPALGRWLQQPEEGSCAKRER